MFNYFFQISNLKQRSMCSSDPNLTQVYFNVSAVNFNVSACIGVPLETTTNTVYNGFYLK